MCSASKKRGVKVRPEIFYRWLCTFILQFFFLFYFSNLCHTFEEMRCACSVISSPFHKRAILFCTKKNPVFLEQVTVLLQRKEEKKKNPHTHRTHVCPSFPSSLNVANVFLSSLLFHFIFYFCFVSVPNIPSHPQTPFLHSPPLPLPLPYLLLPHTPPTLIPTLHTTGKLEKKKKMENAVCIFF